MIVALGGYTSISYKCDVYLKRRWWMVLSFDENKISLVIYLYSRIAQLCNKNMQAYVKENMIGEVKDK